VKTLPVLDRAALPPLTPSNGNFEPDLAIVVNAAPALHATDFVL